MNCCFKIKKKNNSSSHEKKFTMTDLDKINNTKQEKNKRSESEMSSYYKHLIQIDVENRNFNKLKLALTGLPDDDDSYLIRRDLLVDAITNNDVEMLTHLLNAGIDPNMIIDDIGSTPILITKDTDIASLLLEYGAYINAKNRHGKSCYDLAGRDNILKQFYLENGYINNS